MENMERRNQEPRPEVKLENVLHRIYEDQMLQFTTNGYRLYEYIETGETELRTVKVGETEYSYQVNVEEPIVQKDVATLAELFDPVDESEYERYDDGHVDNITSDEFMRWKEDTLIPPEDFQDAARGERIVSDVIETENETIPCTNCKGKAVFENVTCFCTYGGHTFTDLTGESDDATVSLREKGVPDPDCDTCEGSGKTSNACPCCEGSGKSAKYPRIVLKNEITGEERTLVLHLAKLIEEGEVEIGWQGYEKSYPESNYEVAQKTLRFSLSSYIERQLAEMGVDKDNAGIITGNRISSIVTSRVDTSGGNVWWRKRDGEVQINSSDTMIPQLILRKAQTDLAAKFAWPYGKFKDDEGIIRGEEWVMRPLRSIEETLEDLKTVIAEAGYTLGFSHSFIATGETGPSFYLLDSNGNAIEQLSNDYTIRESLENAWLTIQQIRDSFPTPE